MFKFYIFRKKGHGEGHGVTRRFSQGVLYYIILYYIILLLLLLLLLYL